MSGSAPELLAYRQMHDETNVAAATLVALSEFERTPVPTNTRGQELEIHGLIQRGRFLEDRGLLLARALRYMAARGVRCELRHDPGRTARLRERLHAEGCTQDLVFLEDLGRPGFQPLVLEHDLLAGSSLLLLEARAAFRRLPLHVLLVRPSPDGHALQIMNSLDGLNYSLSRDEVASHLNCPIHFGASYLAGGLYLFTGVAVRLGIENAPAAEHHAEQL